MHSSATIAKPRVEYPAPFVTISSSHRHQNIGELWANRELVYLLAWRDVKVRYKQTALGVAWALLQPAMTMLVFTIFFGKLAKLPSGGLPYPVFCFSALLPWMFFANGVTKTSNSLIGSENLIKKVYFPRLAIPLAALGSDLIDLLVSSGFLLLLMAWYRVWPSVNILVVPLLTLQLAMVTFGLGSALAALNVKYRDVRYVVPFMTQFLLFLTPIAYAATLVPSRWRAVYALNPLVGIVEEFRWAFLNAHAPIWPLLVSLLSSVVVLVAGLLYFERMQEELADML